MPTYLLYPLTPGGAPEPPVTMVAFDDAAAMRWAMRQAFPAGCDVFLAGRFVARVHGARPSGTPEGRSPTPPPGPPKAR